MTKIFTANKLLNVKNSLGTNKVTDFHKIIKALYFVHR